MHKLIGCCMVLAATSAAGFHMAHMKRRDLEELRQLCLALETMQREIAWNRLQLDELCRFLSGVLRGKTAALFAWVGAQCIEEPELPVQSLFEQGFVRFHLPGAAAGVYRAMASTFGRYDPEQQLQALENAASELRLLCTETATRQAAECKKDRVFGICIGAAILIFLL